MVCLLCVFQCDCAEIMSEGNLRSYVRRYARLHFRQYVRSNARTNV